MTPSTWRDRLGLPNTAGRRKLVASVALDSVGSGAFLPFVILYFTRTTPMSLASIGVCLSLAALLATPAAPLFGAVVDRLGPRRIIIATNAVRCLLFALYPLADRPWHVVALVCVTTAADNVFWTANGSFVVQVADPGERTRWFALERMLRNAGMGLGSLLGTVAAEFGANGYHLIVWGNAVTFAVAGALVSGWRPAAPTEAPTTAAAAPIEAAAQATAQATATEAAVGRGGYRQVLRDRPFLIFVASHFLLVLSCVALPVLLPVFVVAARHAPSWWPGWLLTVNMVAVVVGQSVLIRATERLERPRIVQISAGLWIVAFLVFMVDPGSGWLLGVCLTGGVLVYTAAEILWTPTTSSMSADAAPDELRGRYMAVVQLSFAAGNVVGPALFTGLLARGTSLPWLVLIVCCAGAAALMQPLTRKLPASAAARSGSPELGI